MGIKKSLVSVKPAKAILIAGVASLFVLGAAWFAGRRYVSSPVLNLKGQGSASLYIPTGATFADVVFLIEAQNWFADEDAFMIMSRLMGYDNSVKPGRYIVSESMSARALIGKLRIGAQDPVSVTFGAGRSLEKVIGVACRHLECDSATLMASVQDTALLSSLGFDTVSRFALFLPDTYQMWWNNSPVDVVQRLKKEYDKFWNKERLDKAAALNLTPVEVATLASIIDEESNKTDEYPIIASLYLNRLRIGMPLQACPTIKYALGDFTIRRVRTVDTQVDSPYNTYQRRGLPPGPIRIPSKSAIDAVLAPASTDFIFMCARPDGSGRHNFSRTLAQHERNAADYHKQLDKKKIYR